MLAHKGTQRIETERLILRPFKLSDANDMFKNWAMKDNTIEIVYANKVFRFATSILFMENIGLNVDG